MTKRNHKGNKNPHHKDGRTNGKRLTLRITDELYEAIQAKATKEGVSVNEFINRVLCNC